MWRDTDLSKAIKSVLFYNSLLLASTALWGKHVSSKSFVIWRDRTSLTAIVERVEQRSEFLKENLSDRPGRPLLHRGGTWENTYFS